MSKLATEDTVEKVACPHDELFFGSGGYYVFCKKCSIAWVAIKGPSCDFQIDMAAGTRARPEMCMGTFKWQSSDARAAINAVSDVREALRDARANYWFGRTELQGRYEFLDGTWEKLKALDDAALESLSGGRGE